MVTNQFPWEKGSNNSDAWLSEMMRISWTLVSHDIVSYEKRAGNNSCLNKPSEYARILCGAQLYRGSASRKTEVFLARAMLGILRAWSFTFFCAVVAEMLWIIAETVMFLCNMTNQYCGDLRRRRIRTKTARSNIKIPARETPQCLVFVMRCMRCHVQSASDLLLVLVLVLVLLLLLPHYYY